MNYLTVVLNPSHKKEKFLCQKVLLDDYLHKQAKQDIKRKLSACFILSDEENNVKGYYTLSNTSISRALLPEEIIKKLPPSYTDLPATLIGRLAIDHLHQGQGLGEALLIDALKRCYDTTVHIASMVVIVDPLDNDAEKFYTKYGFILLPDSGKMFMPMTTVSELFMTQ